MNVPKSYLDRVTTDKNKTPFLFISYSHADNEVVDSILEQLYEKGVNYWYDKELHAGKKWNEEVLEVLNDDKCIGVLFFCSKKFFTSGPCHQEINATKNKILKNNKVQYIPICVESVGVNKMIEAVQTEEQFVVDNLSNIILDDGMFHKDVTYIPYNENTIEKAYHEIKRLLPDSIDNQEMHINRLVASKKIYLSNGNYCYNRCGIYPQNISSNLMQMPTDNDVLDFEDNRYRGVKKTGEFFLYEPISYFILNIIDDKVITIPQKILDIIKVNDESINKWISDFKNSTFNSYELSSIVDIRELNIDDLNKVNSLFKNRQINSTKYSLSKDELAANTFYINCNKQKNNIIYSTNFVEINALYNVELINSGIVPVVIFDLNKLI